MRIAINCRSFLNKNITGIGRYAYHLVDSLSQIDTENHYSLYARKSLFNRKKSLPKFSASNIKPVQDSFNRGLVSCLKDVDIYHSPSPDMIPEAWNVKTVVTIHDLIFKTFPEGHTESAVRHSQDQFDNILKTADKMICCSESTAKDLKKFFSVTDERIEVVYQGVDRSVFYPLGIDEEHIAQQTLKAHNIDQPFLLAVGTIEPRKNLKNTIRAFAHLRQSGAFSGVLVVVGMKGWMTEDIESVLGECNVKALVVFLGFISDADLRIFYNRAEVFIFPSFYEGFGFPIVEAFSCGVPVVTSNGGSCGEVAQDAALIVNPSDAKDLARKIENVLEDKDLSKSLREKGLRRSQDFSFDKTAQETLKVYQSL